MDALSAYRDDGPLAQWLGAVARALRLPAFATTVAAVAALAAGLVLDGRETGLATVAGVTAFVVLAAAPAATEREGRLGWLVPPLLRAAEYGFVVALSRRGGAAALPAVYALLAAVAFHHYDIVYRLRHQRVAPPAWVRWIGLGWDGRTAVVAALAVAGVLPLGAALLAALLGAVFVAESVASWVRLARDAQRVVTVGEDDDDE